MRNARRTQRKTAKTRAFSLRPLALVAAALILAVAPIPKPVVEAVFTRRAYATIQPIVTFASNAVPIAVMDVAALLVLAGLALTSLRDFSRHRQRGVWRAFAPVACRVAVWSAAVYLVFLGAWGFNYRRQSMPERLPFAAGAVTPAAAAQLASLSVSRINALHAAAHAEGWVSGTAIDPPLAGAFDRVARELAALPRGIVVGRPKRSMLDWYFRRAGVSGMTDPIFLETLVASDLLPFERPLVIAHEWAHLAGLADEGEANLAGWLACVRASTADQYSGWLFMYSEAAETLAPRERAVLAQRISDGPRADLAAIRQRTQQNVDPRIASAGWRVYDSYLKANRVEAGTNSYTEVVRLALGLKLAF